MPAEMKSIDFEIGRSTALDITAILCTCNRMDTLTETLETLAASQLPDSISWEVLVVDNNSTDKTRELVQSFSDRYPGRFRYLFEPKPGKCNALNSGIGSAYGEVLAFVDDDVTVDPKWLQNLTAPLLRHECAGVAGRILPAQAFPLPSWLSWKHSVDGFQPDPLAVLCARFDLGDQARDLDFDHAPYGANMAFPRPMFEKYGGFRLDLGPRPKSQIRNEDMEFGRRLINGGERLRYEPSAVVHHPVPLGRISKQFFLSWWFDYGRASIIERGERANVIGIPWDYLSLLRRVTVMSGMMLRGMFGLRPEERFFYKCMIRKEAGMTIELYRRLQRKPTKRTVAARHSEP
jgi:glucosyl-dolichyl phosphate glucuronosyltransferase